MYLRSHSSGLERRAAPKLPVSPLQPWQVPGRNASTPRGVSLGRPLGIGGGGRPEDSAPSVLPGHLLPRGAWAVLPWGVHRRLLPHTATPLTTRLPNTRTWKHPDVLTPDVVRVQRLEIGLSKRPRRRNPGTLPKVPKQSLEKSLRMGEALKCVTIARH